MGAVLQSAIGRSDRLLARFWRLLRLIKTYVFSAKSSRFMGSSLQSAIAISGHILAGFFLLRLIKTYVFSGRSSNSFSLMETLGSKGLVKKSEFIRIIIDALNSLGCNDIGTLLEKEFGIPLHIPIAKKFLEQVKNGEWDKSIATLQKFQLPDENPVKFLLLEKKFSEFLKTENVRDAMNTLREEMVPIGINIKRIHELASKLISTTLVEDTKNVNSTRSKVVEELQYYLPPAVIIPERRLEYLLEESLDLQRTTCSFHNVPDSDLSLCTDHGCWDHKIPSQTVEILKEHEDEVWFVKFSHNGKYLASSSKDKTAIIWEIDADRKFFVKHKLDGHMNPVVAVLWSPDDSQVITCGENEVIRRWNVNSGQCEYVYAKNEVGCVSCGWSSDGEGIIGGMEDRTICLWNLDGSEKEHDLGLRAHKLSDVAMTSDGMWTVSLGREPHEISLSSAVSRVWIREEDMITSFSFSKDDKYLLVNLITQQINLWNIEGEPYRVTRFTGHKRSRFIIRSCFGGYKESYVASGSEDSKVYLWRITTWAPKWNTSCYVLSGHSAAVNCVSVNPTDMHMLASASDDRSIRIWGRLK